MALIDYPLSINSDNEKLEAVYSLKETMRLEYNRQGALARSDPDKYIKSGRWAQYTRQFMELMRPILAEQVKLRESIKYSRINFAEWKSLKADEKADWSEKNLPDKEIAKARPTLAKTVQLDALKLIKLIELPAREVDDPLEDWTTYTENDPNSVLTVAANTITFANDYGTSAARVYADKGASHFGATFEHLTSAKLDSASATMAVLTWALANITNAGLSTDPIICVRFQSNGASPGSSVYTYLMIDDGATDQTDYRAHGTGGWGTRYYYTNDKNATDTDCYIYTDADRTVLEDTLTVANGTTSFQYIYGHCAPGSGTATYSGYSYDHDLQEGGGTNYPESATANLSMTASSSRISGFSRSIAAALLMTASVSRIFNRIKTASTGLAASAAAIKAMAAIRFSTTGLSAVSSTARSYGRTIQSTANLSVMALASRALEWARSTVASLDMTASAIAITAGNYIINAVANLSLTASALRGLNYLRSTISSLSMTSISERVITWARSATANISLTSLAEVIGEIIAIALTLAARIRSFTLRTRSRSLTLHSRSRNLTLPERN